MCRHVGIALMAAVCLASATHAAAPAPAARPQAELDVVVETSLPATPERRKAYLETMLAYARSCLAGLVPATPHDASQTPPPGSTRYRLFIDHDGRVDVDAMSSPAEMVGGAAEGARQFINRQHGVFHIRLGRWDGAAYPTVDRWSSRFRTQHYLPMPADASLEERAQYHRAALNLATPESVKGAILRRLLPIDLARTSGDPGLAQQVTLAVKNRSLWPLKHLDVTVVWCVSAKDRRYRYLAEASFDGRLAPGNQTELRTVGRRDPSIFGWEYTLPVQIDARPVFIPEAVEPK